MMHSLMQRLRFRIMVALVLLFVSVVTATILFAVFLRPEIIAITQKYAQNEVSQVVDSEVKKVMLEELFSYDEITHITRDQSGRVTSISSNTTLINRFTNDLGIEIGNALDEKSAIVNKIHLFSLMGSDFLAGTGPTIPIRFSPISVTNADITHSFEESGINQTIHTINLTVSVEMAIIMPFAQSTVLVESTMPIAQTLIVGVVPNEYFSKK